MQQFPEPRPRREDIPDHVNPGDILHELRQSVWETRQWRAEVNGDLGFLRRFRTLVQFTVVVLGVTLPVATLVVMVTR